MLIIMQTHILTAKSVIKKQPMAVAISIIWPNTPTNHDRRDVRVVISNVCKDRNNLGLFIASDKSVSDFACRYIHLIKYSLRAPPINQK